MANFCGTPFIDRLILTLVQALDIEISKNL